MSVFDTPSRLPQDQPGRDIRCTVCGWLVRVAEEPEGWIDDALFVCGRHDEDRQLAIFTEPPPPETRRYDPRIARIPFGDPPAPRFNTPEPEL